jgi:glycosyltransferase involved in cell wall biosynthesis
MKIIHIITGLNDGGSENFLFKLCKYDKKNKHIVISLTGAGKYKLLLKKIGIKVFCLNANFFSIHKFFYLMKLISLLKPNIVQTWLVHADFIGGIAARLAGVKSIIWNIRYSKLKASEVKLSTIMILRALSIISSFIPQYIIINSKKAKKIYEIYGYDKKKLKYIPNGFNFSDLKPNEDQKKKFKKKNRIKKKTPLIGNVARYDPTKDHTTLLNALSIIQSKKIRFFCILVGTNIFNNKNLTYLIKNLKLKNNVKLMKPQNNISEVMNGIDIHVLSSITESFPNVLAESMACGTPCITTDVGDARSIVGKDGWVIDSKDPNKLANAIEKALSELGSENWKKRCTNGRLKIKLKFNIVNIIKKYNRFWKTAYMLNS